MTPDFESDLTIQQQAFVEEFVVDFNQKRAAIKAGYSERSIAAISSQLLSNPKIKKAVVERLQELGNEREILRERILKQLGKAAFIEMPDALSLKALELLGKHLAMFTEKTEHSGKVQVDVDGTGLWDLKKPGID